jgi:double-stranded uracil-DNA glycosylase
VLTPLTVFVFKLPIPPAVYGLEFVHIGVLMVALVPVAIVYDESERTANQPRLRRIPMASCLEPLARPDARVLILGSIPGEASIAAGQYYAHERNIFWPLLEELLAGGAPLDYPARVEMVLRSRIALWDVISSANRAGSLDSAIKSASEVPNDIPGFLESHPGVTHVFFNGAKAETSFKRHVVDRLPYRKVELRRLPSTSPANAAVSFETKLEAWRAVADAAVRVIGEHTHSRVR